MNQKLVSHCSGIFEQSKAGHSWNPDPWSCAKGGLCHPWKGDPAPPFARREVWDGKGWDETSCDVLEETGHTFTFEDSTSLPVQLTLEKPQHGISKMRLVEIGRTSPQNVSKSKMKVTLWPLGPTRLTLSFFGSPKNSTCFFTDQNLLHTVARCCALSHGTMASLAPWHIANWKVGMTCQADANKKPLFFWLVNSSCWSKRSPLDTSVWKICSSFFWYVWLCFVEKTSRRCLKCNLKWHTFCCHQSMDTLTARSSAPNRYSSAPRVSFADHNFLSWIFTLVIFSRHVFELWLATFPKTPSNF